MFLISNYPDILASAVGCFEPFFFFKLHNLMAISKGKVLN